MNKNCRHIIHASIMLAAILKVHSGTGHAADAGRVAGDLQVEGLWFSGDSNKTVIRKPSDFPAPWTIYNTDIYYTRGNVGIGTPSPTTMLDVNGTAKATEFVGPTIGTTDNTSFEIKVNDSRVLRIEPTATSPNIAAGYAGNVAGGTGISGATVAGGGNSLEINIANGNYCTVGGGAFNTASGYGSTISGGWYNKASVYFSTIGGGDHNTSSGWDSTVGGGAYNTASNDYSTVGGGYGNTASGGSSTVIGGANNNAGADFSFAGGYRAKVKSASDTGTQLGHIGTFLWADSTYSDFFSSASDEFAVRATGGVRFVTAINSTTNAPTRTTSIDGNGKLTTTSVDANSINAVSLTADSIIGQAGGAVDITPNLTVLSAPITSGSFYSGTANANGMMVGGSGTDRYVAMKRDGTLSNVLSVSKGDAGYMLGFYVNGAHVGEISSTASTTSYGTGSDLRLKQNIRPTTFTMADLMKLHVKDYTFIADATNTPQTGFIAQELHEVIPQAVAVGGDDPAVNPWQVDYGKLTPFLVKAMQDLKQSKDAEIAALTTENNTLKARLERLEKIMGITE